MGSPSSEAWLGETKPPVTNKESENTEFE